MSQRCMVHCTAVADFVDTNLDPIYGVRTLLVLAGGLIQNRLNLTAAVWPENQAIDMFIVGTADMCTQTMIRALHALQRLTVVHSALLTTHALTV